MGFTREEIESIEHVVGKPLHEMTRDDLARAESTLVARIDQTEAHQRDAQAELGRRDAQGR